MKGLPVFLFSVFTMVAQAQDGIQFIHTDTPRVFGPGIISDGFSNRDMAISPDGNDLFFTLQWQYGLFSVILHSQKINGVWSKPETAGFSGRFNDLEPAYSPDGERLYFTSNRPLNNTGNTPKDYDIWWLEKKGKEWLGPYNMGTVINSDKDEFYPSLANNGNLYFTRDNGETKDDIFVSLFKNGKYEIPMSLPGQVNSPGFDFNAFIDPDENFIIFSSYKRPDDMGAGDLYYSLRSGDEWQPAQHFGSGINSSSLDYSPFVTADRKYFFFTSKRQTLSFPYPKSLSAFEIKDRLSSYGNGNDDIYIVNFETVQRMMK